MPRRSPRLLLLVLALAATLLPPTVASAQTADDVPVTAAPDDPVVEQVLDADQLLPAETATTGVGSQSNCCGLVFSGDVQVLIGQEADGASPAAPGDSATFAVTVDQAGRYALSADLTTARDYGIVAMSVDGGPVGAPHDAYRATGVAVDRRVPFGAVDLTAGTHQVTLTVAGQNPAADGFLIGLDLLRLRLLPDDGRLALTPVDGAAVSGTVPVVGYSTDPADTTEVTVDGEPVAQRRLLGGDTASLLFANDTGNGLQRGFRNGIRVRGQEYLVADVVVGDGTTAWIDIPGELLQPGTNTVTFFAGTVVDDCNHDDFNLTGVRLELPDGTVVSDPEHSDETIGFGDGVCGSSTKVLEFDYTFEIPEPSAGGVDYDPGSGVTWDTTAVPDGEHTVAVTATGPSGTATREHTVLVDNTLPVITSTSPEEGDRLKGDFTVDATANDGTGSGVASTTATLDGEPVALGSTLSSDDLTDGAHTLVFTVTDEAGNTTTREVAVTSIRERPDTPELVAPEDGATRVPLRPRLRVTASDPADDPLEVTFLQALAARPIAGSGVTGATPAQPPADMDPEGAAPLSSSDVAAADDERAATAASDAFPFQRYDFQLTATDAERRSVGITWEGQIDEAREVVLLAWDVVGGTWTELARERGTGDRDLVLRGEVDLDRFRDGDVVHVLVRGSDPFADDIEDVPDAEFRDPDTYDFSLAWMTDTQYLSEGAVAGGGGAGDFATAYRDINEWIAENAEERKIAYTSHTGDIIENWTAGARDEDVARREFEFASETMAILEDAGMPYGVTPGNHDNRTGTSNELYNEYFPPSRFEAASAEAVQPYYGGAWREGDNQNHYDLFSAGGQDFVVVYLGYIAGQEEIDWANAVVAEHADRSAIFATHEYLLPSGAPDGRDGPRAGQAQAFFDQVILPNDNVFLVLSGHHHGVALNILRDQGAPGRTVVEMLADYQFFEVGGDRRTGHFRLLQFDVDRSEVSVNTYSPALDDHNADEFDTNDSRDYQPSSDEFTVPVDLATRVTSFATDAIRLEERLDVVVGAADVASGDEAGTTWERLEPRTEYFWYARAADAFGGVAESEVFSFTTVGRDGGGPGGPGEPGGPGGGGPRGDGDEGPGDDDGGSGDGTGSGAPQGEEDTDPPGAGGPAGDGDASPTTPRPPLPGDGGTDDDGPRVQRFAADGRTRTALEISRETFGDGEAGGVVLSRPDLYPDALSGTPLAVREDAPLLLTASDGLEPEVAEEIRRVLPAGGRVHLLGGADALDAAVADDVAALGYQAVRLGGATRFETAAIVAERGIGDPSQVLLADGSDFPDAVTAGAAAGVTGGAVLLTGGETLPAETAAYLEGRDAPVYAIGGPAARAVPEATAVAGPERIATSVAVAREFFSSPTVAGLATAGAFPDALAGGAATGRLGGPVLLTYPDQLAAPASEYLAGTPTLDTVMLFGGTEALDATVEDAATEVLGTR